MGFNVDKFKGTTIENKTEEIIVEELADFFDEDDIPVFTLRGLKLEEIISANKAFEKYELKNQLANGIAGTDKEVAKKMAEIISGGELQTSPEAVKMKKYLEYGCVEPKLDFEAVNKIAEYYSVGLNIMYNKIAELTMKGGEVAKKKPKTSLNRKKSST